MSQDEPMDDKNKIICARNKFICLISPAIYQRCDSVRLTAIMLIGEYSVLVDIFRIFEIKLCCFVVATNELVHNVETLYCYNIWIFFLKYK